MPPEKFEQISNSTPSTSTPTPETTTQDPAPEETQYRSPLKQIRTFQGDMAEALEKQKESIYSIQQTEHLKRVSGGMVLPQVPQDTEKKKRIFSYFAGSMVLLLITGVGIFVGYREYIRRTLPPVLSAPDNRFIAAQSNVNIDITNLSRLDLFNIIDDNTLNLKEGDVRHFILRKGEGDKAPLASSTDFFLKTESTAPGAFVRALEPLFMIGTLGEDRFIIFKLSSYENAYAGMLAWEETIAQEIGPIFKSREVLKNITAESVFKDVVSQNKDVRVLSGPVEPGSATSTTALLYSFLNKDELIITESLEALQTLIDRLTRERLSR